MWTDKLTEPSAQSSDQIDQLNYVQITDRAGLQQYSYTPCQGQVDYTIYALSTDELRNYDHQPGNSN